MNIGDKISFYLTFVSALGSGLIAGTFFVFSVAIMSALRRLPANEGMAAMQSINTVIQNPLFLGVFMGTALTSLVIAGMSIFNWNSTGSAYLLVGAILYFVGTFLLTIVFNVPLNNALDAADPATPAGQEFWKNYLTNWTFWNHVRTIASLLATASFTIGLVYRGAQV